VSLKKLGRYDLVRVLGRGAMGVVYEGRDPNLDRRVAIKTVKVENLSEAAAAEYEGRFRTEARSAARLQHPNIVSVYDSDRHGDIAYLVMEFVQGEDLKHHIDRGVRYSFDDALKIMADLLSALEYAHKQNVVHRDIKPANLLMEPSGRVKLTDFGVARIADSGEATRTKGAIVGTLKYMAPEQVQGLAVDSRADLFSAGVVLYQLLTDKRPFDGDNDFSIIHQIISNVPAAPSSFNRALPPAMDAVVDKALAKDRAQRFATAGDFAKALQAAAGQMDDTTVIPPADPLKQLAAAAAGIVTKGSNVTMGSNVIAGVATNTATNSTVSNTAVTQELELVYWKDVKDSTDPEELQEFLVRFPTGIYADLARRRLKKLGEGPASPDDTTTRLMPAFVAPAAAPAPAPAEEASSAVPVAQGSSGPSAQTTAASSAAAAVSPAPRAAEAAAAKPGATKAKPAGKPAAGPKDAAKPKGLVYGLAGAAVAVAVIAFFALKPAADKPADAALAAASAPAAVASAGVPEKAASQPASPSIAAAPVAAAAPQPVAAASRPASGVRVARPAAVTASRPPVPLPSEAAVRIDEPRPREARPAATASAAATATAAASGGPKAACEGRILLGFEICMKEQCEKPAFQNNAVCVERREMERRRRSDRQMLP
jgi:eukaryotic-like serine/threonine-protein kinase